MSRYACHACGTEHGTENMVAYCAACYCKAVARAEDFRAGASAEAANYDELREECDRLSAKVALGEALAIGAEQVFNDDGRTYELKKALAAWRKGR